MEAMTYEDYKLALQGASSEEHEELMSQACADPGITWDDFVDLFGISELVNSPTYQKCWGGCAMEVMDYTNLVNRFGKRLEKAIAQDFPGDEEVSGNIHSALVKLQYTILGAFMRTTDDKEKK